MVFPASGDVCQFGERILVAWKAGRESVRAVNDALPFLQTATDVSIVAVVTNKTDQSQEKQSMAMLQQHLERSGIKARLETLFITKGTVAAAILEQAHHEQSDLIVLGGFAYKSNRAPVLSPLTQELLIKAPVPLLISH